jgi:translocation and assembly module TamB
MKRRWLKVFLIFMVVIASLLMGGVYGILHTTAGARLLLSFVEGQLNDSLELGVISGTLSSGLEIDTIDFRDVSMAVTLDSTRLAVEPKFFPLLIQIHFLEVSTLKIRQGNPPAESTQTVDTVDLGETLASLALPIPIILSRLELGSIEYFSPSGAPVFSAEHISSALQLHDVLDVGHLALESNQSRIELNGSLGLSAPFPVILNSKASLALDGETIGGLESIDVQASLHGELEKSLEINITTATPEITISGELHELLGKPAWDLSLKSAELSWVTVRDENQEGGEYLFKSLDLKSHGRLGDYQLETSSILHIPGMNPVSLNLSSNGNETGMVITALHLAGPQLELAAEGDIQWQDETAVRLSALLDRFDPSTLLPGWPEEHHLQGRFELALANDGLELTEMQLLVPGTTTRMDSTATIDLDQGVLEADLAWSDIAWPIASEEPEFLSQAGEVHLSGSPDDWVLSGDTMLQTAGFPPGQLRLEANGNRESAEMNIVQGRLLDGELTGELEFSWTGETNWSARLNARGIETGILLPDWPGSISTELKADGSLEPFRLNLDILQLDGEIRERPVTASGQLHLQGEQQLDADIRLALGNSRLDLQGELFAAEGLVFSVNIDDLGYFLPSGSGSVQANGRASLLPGKPRIRLNLDAEQLGWNGISVKELSIHDSAGLSADNFASLLLVASQIELNNQSVDEIRLDLFADPAQQSVGLAASYSGVEFSTQLNGALVDWQYIIEAGWTEAAWNGQIESIKLGNGSQLSLQLEKPAPLQLSANSAALENACIGTGKAQRICLNTQWQRNGAYSASAVLHEFPLSIMEEFLDNDLTFTQQLSGEYSLTGAYSKPPSSQARFDISPGVISTRSESGLSIETGPGAVGFSLDRGKLVTGTFDLPLPGNGDIDIDFQLPDISAGENTQIDSHAVITLHDLGEFSPLLPFLDRVAGKFDAQLDASGGLLHPALSGYISITDGLIQHDASGLKLHDMQLAGRLLGGGQSRLSGSFKAQEGSGELQADIDLSDVLSPRFEVTLTGEQLTLFDSPELLLVAEPDIKLGWNDGTIEINGSILIPRARIAPKTIPAGTSSESADLVIVAGKIPGSDKKKKPDQELAIHGELEIALGDEIELDLGLAVAQLDGSAIFSWQDKLVPMATGRYGIVGEINAFGQQLSITEGSISFPDIPADNPHLDIRAVRQIYGNSEIRRAGVFVNGTLKRMVVEPYTDPMTTRERAQTLLITGSDFNMEQGVGAVDIGTYIAPRFFLAYGIGVFEDENVISLRYDLGRRWGVKVTSGQRTSGIDINYVIER